MTADEPKAVAGTLNEAADRLRLQRSPPAAPIRLLQRRWGRLVLGQEESFSSKKEMRSEQSQGAGFGTADLR